MSAEQKLLLDEMLTGEIATQLRAKGHDVLAVVEDRALVQTPDEDLLGYATSVQRCLVTANVRDFTRISAAWSRRGRPHAGLIYIVNRVFPNDRAFVGAVVRALDGAIASSQIPCDGLAVYLRRPHSPG